MLSPQFLNFPGTQLMLENINVRETLRRQLYLRCAGHNQY